MDVLTRMDAAAARMEAAAARVEAVAKAMAAGGGGGGGGALPDVSTMGAKAVKAELKAREDLAAKLEAPLHAETRGGTPALTWQNGNRTF